MSEEVNMFDSAEIESEDMTRLYAQDVTITGNEESSPQEAFESLMDDLIYLGNAENLSEEEANTSQEYTGYHVWSVAEDSSVRIYSSQKPAQENDYSFGECYIEYWDSEMLQGLSVAANLQKISGE